MIFSSRPSWRVYLERWHERLDDDDHDDVDYYADKGSADDDDDDRDDDSDTNMTMRRHDGDDDYGDDCDEVTTIMMKGGNIDFFHASKLSTDLFSAKTLSDLGWQKKPFFEKKPILAG